jgi:hypothetical protein
MGAMVADVAALANNSSLAPLTPLCKQGEAAGKRYAEEAQAAIR